MVIALGVSVSALAIADDAVTVPVMSLFGLDPLDGAVVGSTISTRVDGAMSASGTVIWKRAVTVIAGKTTQNYIVLATDSGRGPTAEDIGAISAGTEGG